MPSGKHRHRRTSSTLDEPAQESPADKVVLKSEISSELTMKLVEASEKKSNFQIIVDSFNLDTPEGPANGPNSRQKSEEATASTRRTPFSEYFEIEEINFLKEERLEVSSTSSESGSTVTGADGAWTPRAKLHYHRDVKLKVTQRINQKSPQQSGGGCPGWMPQDLRFNWVEV